MNFARVKGARGLEGVDGGRIHGINFKVIGVWCRRGGACIGRAKGLPKLSDPILFFPRVPKEEGKAATKLAVAAIRGICGK